MARKRVRIGKRRKEIERKREEMIRSGMVKGLKHPDTVKLSEELDKLLNLSMIGGAK